MDAFEEFSGNRPEAAWIDSINGLPLSVQMNLPVVENHPSTVEERVRRAMALYESHADLVTPFAPALKAFERLIDGGIPVALVTSRNRDELDWITSLFPVLGKATVRVSSSDVTFPKPHREPLDLACRLMSGTPSESVYIGDTVHDAACAASADCPFIAVTYGSGDPESLAAQPNVFLCNTPEQLLFALEPLFEYPLCPN